MLLRVYWWILSKSITNVAFPSSGSNGSRRLSLECLTLWRWRHYISLKSRKYLPADNAQHEIFAVLDFCAEYVGLPPTFRDSVLVPYINMSKKERFSSLTSWFFNIWSIPCPETSVTNQSTTSDNPDERRVRLHHAKDWNPTKSNLPHDLNPHRHTQPLSLL
jgi:hypothetical protein